MPRIYPQEVFISVPPVVVPSGIIFQDDFSNDTGFSAADSGLFVLAPHPKVPSQWSGFKANTGSSIRVIPSGVGGSNCMVLDYEPNPPRIQPTISLVKHLTGNINTGYDELYIRYHVKFPDTFRAGDGDGALGYWKWGRLWQNTDPSGSNWTENREDSGFIMFNWSAGDASIYQTNLAVSWAAASGVNLENGSNGGERYRTRFNINSGHTIPKSGHFENMGGGGAWELEWSGMPNEPAGRFKNTPQDWHTVEYRFKLASAVGADDGEQQIWFDGVDQGPYSEAVQQGGLVGASGIPTPNRGSGLNCLVCFDNMQDWNNSWGDVGVNGNIMINDVVISTQRIGHDYVPTL